MHSTDQTKKPREYAVKQVRGPFVDLAPHKQACNSEEEFFRLCEDLQRDAPLAAGLFCGAGGFSLGLEDAGFHVVLGVDTGAEARDTRRHHFPGLTLDWDLSDESRIEAVAELIKKAKVRVIFGGPPCQPFSKAGRSLMRELVRTGRRPEHDERRDLWQGFLQVVRLSEPEAILFENVPDLALDRDMLILRTLVDELESLGYAVNSRILDSWRYGVPQHRQRFILVALSEGRKFEWPETEPDRTLVRHAIEDLPPVEGGWRPEGGAEGWNEYGGPQYTFQRRMRREVPADQEDRIYDHITRPVREDDAVAFAQMDSSTRYSDLPEELKRYRDDIFDDKYKRLDWDELSRTITAHIAKDGYWYIHPDQDRTLTVREAARLQTFPDHFRFAGPPSKAFRQIGNAVPPRLAEHLGRAVLFGIEEGEPADLPSTKAVSRVLAEWLVKELATPGSVTPWFDAAVGQLAAGQAPAVSNRWLVCLGELLFGRTSLKGTRLVRAWKVLEESYREPGQLLDDQQALRGVAFGLGKDTTAELLLNLAKWLVAHPGSLDDLDELVDAPGVSRGVGELAFRVVPGPEVDLVMTPGPVVRVAARFNGTQVDNTNIRSHGRLAVARLIGVDDEGASAETSQPWQRFQGALAHISLIELGRKSHSERAGVRPLPTCV